MNIHPGHTRSRGARDHLLQTPDTFVFAPLPGMHRGTAAVHASPAMGAAFAQYTARLDEGGSLGPAYGSRFLYVLEGAVALDAAGQRSTLGVSGFAYLPEGTLHTVTAVAETRVAVIEKPYLPVAGSSAPDLLVGNEYGIPGEPLLGDETLQVRALLPPGPAFDFAVNTMEYQPGAQLSMVEIHMMEHGLLMLEGEGIYRLGDAWYPVTQGDFIWMAPFCPQWFGALGKKPAKYLIYKDWNRHPLVPQLDLQRGKER